MINPAHDKLDPGASVRQAAGGAGAPLFQLDSVTYDTASLSAEGRVLLERLAFVQQRLEDLSNNAALLHKAKNAYIADLKQDLVRGRAGLDFGALLGDE